MCDSIDKLLERIENLESENRSLRQWQSDMNTLCSSILQMMEQQSQKLNEDSKDRENLWHFATINRWRIDSMPYEVLDPEVCLPVKKPKLLSITETRHKVIKEGYSIARFGDGEFAAIRKMQRWNFQGVSEYLSERLKEVLQTKDDKILIALNPFFYGSLFHLPELDADGVRAYMRPEVRKFHSELLDPERTYADALFHNMSCDEDVKEIKKLWNDRDCVIIEGVHTGSGVGNDLFGGCNSLQRIICPAENAVDVYDEILKKATEQPKDKLMLLALGPTATVLAYDLYKAGYQAVDMGHLDLIYEKYLRKESDLYKVKIPYKYCSADERVAGREIEDITDTEYLQQVIARIEV